MSHSLKFVPWVKRNSWNNIANVHPWIQATQSRHKIEWSRIYLETTFNDKHLISFSLGEQQLLDLLNELRDYRGKGKAILPEDNKHHCCHYGEGCETEIPF